MAQSIYVHTLFTVVSSSLVYGKKNHSRISFNDLGISKNEVIKPTSSDFPFGKHPFLQNNILLNDNLGSQNKKIIWNCKYVSSELYFQAEMPGICV